MAPKLKVKAASGKKRIRSDTAGWQNVQGKRRSLSAKYVCSIFVNSIYFKRKLLFIKQCAARWCRSPDGKIFGQIVIGLIANAFGADNVGKGFVLTKSVSLVLYSELYPKFDHFRCFSQCRRRNSSRRS